MIMENKDTVALRALETIEKLAEKVYDTGYEYEKKIYHENMIILSTAVSEYLVEKTK